MMYHTYSTLLDYLTIFQTNVLFQIILLVFTFVLLTTAYANRKRGAQGFRNLPSLKLGFWQVLGHIHIILHRSPLTKTMHSPHVYDFRTICAFTRTHEKKPFVLVWFFTLPIVFLFRWESVKVVLSSSTQLRKGWFYSFMLPWLGTGLLTSYGEKWKQRRKLLTPTFHFNILKTFQAGINRQAKILVDILKETTDEEWVDVAPYVTRCSLDIIGETTLGVEIKSQTDYDSEYVQAILGLSDIVFTRTMSPWLWPEWMLSLSPTGRKFWRYNKIARDFTMKVIADRKKEVISTGYANEDIENENDVYRGHKGKAFLDFLLEEHLKNKNFSEDDIREEVDTFTFEGHDTTAMGMTWALYLIGLYPEVQSKIQLELDQILGDDERDVTMDDIKYMKYMECVLKESQRLYPSVPLFVRELDEDIVIQGDKIPRGSNCAVVTYMLHRDPEVFRNPERFDPDRFLPENSVGRDPFAYVPFSAGPRNCVGQKFAMMEEKIVLSTVLKNYSVRSLDQRDQVQVVADLILRPAKEVRIQFRHR